MNFSCPLTASAGDPVRTRLRSVWRDSNVWPLLASLPPPSNTVRSAASVSPTLTRRSCPPTSACRAARCWPCPPSRQRTPSTSPRPCPPAQSRDQDPQTGPLCTAITSSMKYFQKLLTYSPSSPWRTARSDFVKGPVTLSDRATPTW